MVSIPSCYINELGDIKSTNDLFDYIINDNNIVDIIEFNDLSWESTLSYTYLLEEIRKKKSIDSFKNHKLIELPLKNKNYTIQLTGYDEKKGIYVILKAIKDAGNIEDLTTGQFADAGTKFNRIAAIDDSNTSCKMIKFCAYRLGIQCDTYSDVSKVDTDDPNHKYDFLLVDLNMPVTTGFDFINKNRACFPGAKFVAISAYMSETLMTECMQAGFDSFVSKPITVDKIRSIVADFQ